VVGSCEHEPARSLKLRVYIERLNDYQILRKKKLLHAGSCYIDGRPVDSIWDVMAHGDAREGKWRGNWRMEWVSSTLHTTSERGVSSITTVDAHTSAASSRLNWRPRRFKWTRPFRRKTKSGFCACAITFQLAYTTDRVPAICGSLSLKGNHSDKIMKLCSCFYRCV